MLEKILGPELMREHLGYTIPHSKSYAVLKESLGDKMKTYEHNQACPYEGPLEKVLKPRPSTKSTKICPCCLEEVNDLA